MIAPSGGFFNDCSSMDIGVSVFVFQRTRHAGAGLNSTASAAAVIALDLPQRRDVVEHPESAPVRARRSDRRR